LIFLRARELTTKIQALDPERQSLPLYLNPESLFCKPLISHNTQTHNVVLKVTVPKRTGRKRKRGSDGPWQGDVEIGDAAPSNGNGAGPVPEQVRSQSRLDDPKLLRAKLAENVGKYDVEPVGVIRNTHRFRGLADFYWDTSNRSKFAQRYAEQALSAEGWFCFRLCSSCHVVPNALTIQLYSRENQTVSAHSGCRQGPSYRRYPSSGLDTLESAFHL
jgi:hypothetical protein